MERFNESELLKNNRNLIHKSYENILNYTNQNQQEKEENLDAFLMGLFNVFYEEWQLIYPKYIESIISNDVMATFHKVQLHQMETEFDIPEEINEFAVIYYLAGYFNLFITPYNQTHSNNGEIRYNITKDKDINQNLYDIFEEMWNKIAEKVELNDVEWDEFDLELFYEVEESFLQKYLSKCWKQNKAKLNSKTKAILCEHSGAGEIYYLDESRVIKSISEFLK
ncbi:hypothetical protein DFQ05_1006 [Winogradskyella wandonensis]|uniref:Uncharacterized protein n=1 Tax=Winogradskyella wandonensis TaxID=1442586 RepID=A0A4R1KRN9_9FLAO|nr:hypothetical protein [Winogradskyella wandonensis]TCK67233.1 hypothetical protein DFQ05_1006 [Winogradskyella wandonensis]